MINTYNSILAAIIITFLFFPAIDLDGQTGQVEKTCCHNDGPGCACFIDSGSWSPSGTWIQEVALATLGTEECCVDEGGKPYYQMRLGISDINIATFMSCFFEAFGDPYGREAWCSETISYWHKMKGIPYNAGYRNSDWLFDWQLTNTNDIRSFYETEEQLPNGRGRWIDHTDPDYLDYNNFHPGENAPVPGSYVFIQEYVPTGPSSGTWVGCNHSMMIDSMLIYREYLPTQITRVKATILEGNSGPVGAGIVKNTRVIEDLLQATPVGTSFVSYCHGDTVRKIRGFGIDLDGDGDPIYDPGRLKYLVESYEPPVVDPWPDIDDLAWDMSYAARIPQLVDYAKTIGKKGPDVFPSSDLIEMPQPPDPRIPDGVDIKWVFPWTLDRYESNGVYVKIDLMKDHPLPIKGIVLGWSSDYLPDGYAVRWASDEGRYSDAPVPSLAGMAPPSMPGIVPIPVIFQQQGAAVRHVMLIFPYGTFSETAVLSEIGFLYDWGPETDAPYNPPVGACCLPDGSCTTTTERICEDYQGTYQGDDILCLGDADGNEIDDRCELSQWRRGDPNRDGLINVLDVIVVVNHILNIAPLPSEVRYLADCNADGQINVLDALGIVNDILGIGQCEP